MSSSRYEHLTKEELVSLLIKRDMTRKLGLVWEREDIEHENAPNDEFIALDLDPMESVGQAPYTNLLIEGDNFDALRYLRIAYKGRVKCIYIDPPYNTGNRDFIYNDSFVNQKDDFRHSKWLEFMYRRLLLAKDLLTDDGVLLVSINDENRARLELLLEQTMQNMRVGSFVWRKRRPSNAANMDYFFSGDHEHVLVFAGPNFQFSGSEKKWSGYSNWDEDKQDFWASGDLTLGFNRDQRENLYYPLYNPETNIWYPCDPSRVWVYALRERLGDREVRTQPMDDMIAQKRVHFIDEPTPAYYQSLDELEAAVRAGTAPLYLADHPDKSFWIGKRIGFNKPRFKRFKQDLKRESQPLSSWIAELGKAGAEGCCLESGMTSEGTKALRGMGLDKDFSYPKPPSLIKALIDQATDTASGHIVMDFFAGSGTTGHAVLALNKEDGGNRSFVLVSSTEATAKEPEKSVCRDITAKRLRAAIEGYTDRNPKKKVNVDGLGGGFAYMRARRIPRETMAIDIRHDQIWFVLQQLHATAVSTFEKDKPIQVLNGEGYDIMYVPKLDSAAFAALMDRAESSLKHCMIYSWQPGLITQRLTAGHVTVEKVPDYLIERFGRVDL